MSVSLRSLSDSDILSSIRDLAARERKITCRLLLHLNEIERRKLHLKRGYSSMFDYCTSGLGYSEPAAARRLRTARCVARFPEIQGLLESNQVNLSTISRASRVLTAENREALLARICGKSQREVDAIVAEFQPLAKPHDVATPVVVRVAVTENLSSLALKTSSPTTQAPLTNAATTSSGSACEKSAYCRSDSDFHPTQAFATERRVQYRFTGSEAFQRKLEKIRSVAWHRLPANPSLEQVFDLLMDAYLDKHDPHARRKRRLERPKSLATVQPKTSSRYVAAATRDEVFVRDGNRCRFVAADGKRCGSSAALQIDHIHPVARGGASTLDNLRLLCAYHNRLEAQRLLGCSGRGAAPKPG